ncbi:MAG: TetR/AcrR family transcriptional regulator [Rhodoglobus sp.]
MTTTRPAGRGRPPAASRELLQEAAFELFVETGYLATTIDAIATRAGVSRNTFFNYFEAKGDVFWVELDATTQRLKSALAGTVDTRQAILVAVAPLDSHDVPFVLTQYDLIGSVTELQASAMSRFSTQARLLNENLRRSGVAPDAARAKAYSLVACVIAAAQQWAQAGPLRGRLQPYVVAAIDSALGAE